MNDLPEFLLARITEDEAAAFRWHDMECDLPLAGMDGLRMAAEVPGAVCDCGGPARVLAECDAKRRIVDSANYWIKRTQSRRPDMTPTQRMTIESRARAAEETLRFLALPYADHPDFHEEWRP